MRSPSTVCWRMNSHSSSLRGPGWLRIASGMAILPMSCSSEARLRVASPPEPNQQAVAGGMAEGVVVGLEAVEVEEREQVGSAAGLVVEALEVEEELAAVGEAGQRIGLERGHQAVVLNEGEGEPDDDRDQ